MPADATLTKAQRETLWHQRSGAAFRPTLRIADNAGSNVFAYLHAPFLPWSSLVYVVFLLVDVYHGACVNEESSWTSMPVSFCCRVCVREKSSAVCLLTSSSKHRLVIQARCHRQKILLVATTLSGRSRRNARHVLFGLMFTNPANVIVSVCVVW